MPQTWRAIKFIEGQTVEEFLQQFEHYDAAALKRRIEWSSLGGIFDTALRNPSPHDGRSYVHLPIVEKEN